MNEITAMFQEFGFTQNQAELYLTLLQKGICSASQLAHFTHINRSTVYQELTILIQKGFVSYVIKNSKRYYHPAPPQRFLEILDTRKKQFTTFLPTLLQLQSLSVPLAIKIQVYEGKEGIKSFYQHILNSGVKEVFAFGVTGYAFDLLRHSWPQFAEKFLKAGITARYLANPDARKRLTILPSASVTIKYLPKQYTSPVTTAIFGNFIAHQSIVPQNIYVVLMEDKNLARGYRNYFEFLWKHV